LKKENHLFNSYYFIEGDAAQDEILEKAGIEKASVLVSVIDSDSDGLYIALAGRTYNPDMYIIVRANEQSAKPRMIRAGANKVVLPFVMSGLKVAETVINPAVEDFLSISGMDIDGQGQMIQLADLYVTEHSTVLGSMIKSFGQEMKKLIIVGIRKDNGEFIFYPKGDYIFEKGDCLISMGEQSDYREAKKKFVFSSSSEPQ